VAKLSVDCVVHLPSWSKVLVRPVQVIAGVKVC